MISFSILIKCIHLSYLLLILFIHVMAKLQLLQSSVSHDPSEIF